LCCTTRPWSRTKLSSAYSRARCFQGLQVLLQLQEPQNYRPARCSSNGCHRTGRRPAYRRHCGGKMQILCSVASRASAVKQEAPSMQQYHVKVSDVLLGRISSMSPNSLGKAIATSLSSCTMFRLPWTLSLLFLPTSLAFHHSLHHVELFLGEVWACSCRVHHLGDISIHGHLLSSSVLSAHEILHVTNHGVPSLLIPRLRNSAGHHRDGAGLCQSHRPRIWSDRWLEPRFSGCACIYTTRV